MPSYPSQMEWIGVSYFRSFITTGYCYLFICLYGKTCFCHVWLVYYVWLVLIACFTHAILLNLQYKLVDALNKVGYCMIL